MRTIGLFLVSLGMLAAALGWIWTYPLAVRVGLTVLLAGLALSALSRGSPPTGGVVPAGPPLAPPGPPRPTTHGWHGSGVVSPTAVIVPNVGGIHPAPIPTHAVTTS